MLPGCLYEGLPANGAAPLCCKGIQAYVSRGTITAGSTAGLGWYRMIQVVRLTVLFTDMALPPALAAD